MQTASRKKYLPSDSAMYTPAHTHSGENIGKTGVDVLIVEFKTPAAGTATVPSARDNMAIKVAGRGSEGGHLSRGAEPAQRTDRFETGVRPGRDRARPLDDVSRDDGSG